MPQVDYQKQLCVLVTRLLHLENGWQPSPEEGTPEYLEEFEYCQRGLAAYPADLVNETRVRIMNDLFPPESY